MKNYSSKSAEAQTPAIAASLNQGVDFTGETSKSETARAGSDTEKRMLLFRLSEAATRIRSESDLIRRSAFTDQTGRLLRILGETVEEQRLALAGLDLVGESK